MDTRYSSKYLVFLRNYGYLVNTRPGVSSGIRVTRHGVFIMKLKVEKCVFNSIYG